MVVVFVWSFFALGRSVVYRLLAQVIANQFEISRHMPWKHSTMLIAPCRFMLL